MPRSGSSRPLRALAVSVEASKAPAITRAIAVLRLLGRSPAPLGLQPIARELGIVPSTCLYVLRALVAEGFVSFDPATKLYALDAGVLALARDWLRRDGFSERVQPVLARISAEHGVTALAVQISGYDHMTVIGVARAFEGLAFSADVGSRFPALISATGRCVAAFGTAPAEELARRFADLKWDSPPSFTEWMEEVEQARTCGWAVDQDRYIAGVTVAAAPVRDGDAISRGLAAVGLSSRLRGSALLRLGEALRSAARMVSDPRLPEF